MIATIASGGDGDDSPLSKFDAEKLSLPLHFTSDAARSKIYGSQSMPRDVYGILSTQNVTTNWHHAGVSPTAFRDKLEVKGMLATSYNGDRNGNQFVSTMEHREHPIYATQWHPEANQYRPEYASGDATPARTLDAIRAMQHLSNFFVDQARMNNHSFSSKGELADLLIVDDDMTGAVLKNRKYWLSKPDAVAKLSII